MFDQFTDAEILAMTAWGENRGGGAPGMQSVLNVIQNRAKSPGWWGHTMRDICLKPQQFSCWDVDDPNYKKLLTVNAADAEYATALSLAYLALDGTLQDITDGATYYFAKSVTKWPQWAEGHVPCCAIRGQVFFNDIA